MRFKHITIRNARGFDELDSDLPAVAIIQGDNEEGKTSFLDCITYYFQYGHNPRMLKVGTEKGEIILTLEDGTLLRSRFSANSTERTVKRPGSTKWEASAESIKKLANAISYDPFSFLSRPKRTSKGSKGRLETLLEVAPVDYTEEELAKALGDIAPKVSTDVEGMTAFEAIAAYRQKAYDLRTGTNGTADTLSKHAKELRESLAADQTDNTDWKAKGEEATTALEALRREQEVHLNSIRDELSRGLSQAQREYDAACLAALKIRDSKNAALHRDANQQVDAERKANEAAFARLNAEVATANDHRLRSASVTTTRANIDKAEKQAADAKAMSDAYTAAIKRLDDLNAVLAGRMKLPGVRIQGDDIVNEEGVPFESWNEATASLFCLRIAMLAYGELGFIVCDGMQRWTGKRRQRIVETAVQYAEEHGLQFFLANAVQDVPLTISSAQEATPAVG